MNTREQFSSPSIFKQKKVGGLFFVATENSSKMLRAALISDVNSTFLELFKKEKSSFLNIFTWSYCAVAA